MSPTSPPCPARPPLPRTFHLQFGPSRVRLNSLQSLVDRLNPNPVNLIDLIAKYKMGRVRGLIQVQPQKLATEFFGGKTGQHMTFGLVNVLILHFPSVFSASPALSLVLCHGRSSFLPPSLPPSLPSFLLPPPGVRSAGQHLSGKVVVGQVTFVCHCFAPHTSPREKGKELNALHLPLA